MARRFGFEGFSLPPSERKEGDEVFLRTSDGGRLLGMQIEDTISGR